MTCARPVRVGVVGVGRLGRHHARLYPDVDGVQLVGVTDADPIKAAQVAAEFGTRAFASAADLLAAVDAVSIAVPTSAHAPVALAALRAGRHVLVEKPIAATVAEVDAMIRASESADLTLMVGHVERFNPAVAALKARVEAPLFIEAHRLALFEPRATDVDVVLDLMIHDLDLALWLVGEPVADLDAVGVPVVTEAVDIANARLKFPSGAVANVTASRVSREKVRKLRLFQRDAYFSVDCLTGDIEACRRLPGAPAGNGAVATLERLVERMPLEVEPRNALADELTAFVRAVRGESAPEPSADAGRAALALALAVRARIGETRRQVAGARV